MKMQNLMPNYNQFQRSINLIEDVCDVEAIDNYVWSTSNALISMQIFEDIEDVTKNSAFSIVGAYGSGKSALILRVLQIYGLGNKTTQKNSIKKVLDSTNFDIHFKDKVQKYNGKNLFLLVYGKNYSLKNVILKSMRETIQREKIHAPNTKKNIDLTLKKNHITLKEIFTAFSIEVNEKYNNLFLAIDEFGKFLEYNSVNPHQNDLLEIQELIEMRRNNLNFKLIVFVIHHQSFEGYANYLSKSKQLEWQKIQGRFKTINVTNKINDSVSIICNSFNTSKTINETFGKYSVTLAELANLPFITQEWLTESSLQLLNNVSFINPVALFALPLLANYFGQSTRTVSCFLNGNDKFSLNYFFSELELGRNLNQISLSELYDFFNFNRAMQSQTEKGWVNIEVALNRIENSDLLSLKLIKTIGLLNILKNSKNYPASYEIIFQDFKYTGYSVSEIKTCLEVLKAHQILVYRKFSCEFLIWEGSDLNIESFVHKRKELLIDSAEIIEKQNEYFRFPPIIAKRHYENTGTLRLFSPKFFDSNFFIERFENTGINKDSNSEGCLALVVSFNIEEFENAKLAILNQSNKENIIYIIVKFDDYLLDMLKEFIALKDSLNSEAELSSDLVANREVKNRIDEAFDRLNTQFYKNFWLLNNTNVLWSNQIIPIKRQRQINELMSKSFVQYFSFSPECQNELMNKVKISTSASTAFKNLIRSLLLCKGNNHLELNKTPGSKTIFNLFYKRYGFYEMINGKYAFKEPSDPQWKIIWQKFNDYFDERLGVNVPIQDVLNYFEAAPYGIRQPVMMMFLIAYLETPNTGLALYDEGTYVPQKDDVLYEILAKRPKHFTLRKFGKTSNEKNILNALYKVMTNEELPDSEEILFDVLKVLYRPIRLLPSFVNQTRQEISETSQQIRNAFLKANKPDELVFKVIPQILGFPENELLSKNNEKAAKAYALKVKDAIDELSAVINIVTQKCLKIMQKVFNLGGKTPQTLRVDFVKRVGLVEAVASDPRVKNLILKVKNTGLKDDKWAESVLSAITVKPINSWNDFDYTDFENKCIEIYRPFKNYELLATGMFAADAPNTEFSTRFSITSSDGTDINHVVFEKPDNKETKKKMADIKANLADLDPAQAQAVLLELLKTYHQSLGVK